MLCLPCCKPETVSNHSQTLTIDAKIDNLHEVLGFVDAFLEELDCPPKAQMQIDIAVEELFVNIASYAYPDSEGTAEISLCASEDPKTVTITLRDSGIPYDPTLREDPDITLVAEERDIGGLGVFMVKKYMDTVHYAYEEGQNTLTITKKIE